MNEPVQAGPGRFCWIDLAATDAARAEDFYGRLFGWTARAQPANGGTFTRLALGGRDVGSMYQLSRAQIANGACSHWTPYVRVDNADAVARRAAALGGGVLVPPFDVEGIARIGLIQDPAGATLGLWQAHG